MLALAQQSLFRTVLTTEVKKGCRPPGLREWHMDNREQVAESWAQTLLWKRACPCVCLVRPLPLGSSVTVLWVLETHQGEM